MNDERSTVDDTISSRTSDRTTPTKPDDEQGVISSSSSFSDALNVFKMREASTQKSENKHKVNGSLKKGSLLDNSIDSIFSFDKSPLDCLDKSGGQSDESTKVGRNHCLYVLVVGFHHKKGCQIDYCYPPMTNEHAEDEDELQSSPTNRLPNIWKTLPSIALPDGSHNYDRDTIYFHLPHPRNTHKTIFGISCYRQISAEQLKEKDEDVTRGTVQKSVVVLSELPLYGECVRSSNRNESNSSAE